jgi:hypothetical protein
VVGRIAFIPLPSERRPVVLGTHLFSTFARGSCIAILWGLTHAAVGVQAQLPVREYQAPWAAVPPSIDGRLDDAAWAAAPWSEAFVDIEGSTKPAPRWATRVKMTWDADHLYLAAALEEPDLWATITTRDAVIYRDNDFEWFIDPDGDTNRYFELEINALGTVWDLFLDKPYRFGGRADNGWDIAGLRSGVHLDGTLNDPTDRDRGWSVEMAIPWKAFADSGRTAVPPVAGARWRINFSRVQWELDVVDGRYQKRVGSDGKALPEYNWVWSPQGVINMHIPERWGGVTFLGPRHPNTESP